MTMIRQPSFAGGELSPTLYGRSDLAKYAVGCRTLRNFFVAPHGAALNRPGTRFVAQTKLSQPVRLVHFAVSDSENYLLEFGHLYIRFHALDANGNPGPVLVAGSPYEVATTYTMSELTELRTAQVGDVMTIVHRAHIPRELKHISTTPFVFTIGDISFATAAPFFAAEPAIMSSTLQAGDEATTNVRPSKEWQWAVTTIGQLADGTVFESAPFIITHQVGPGPGFVYSAAPAKVCLYSDRPISLSFDIGGLVVAPTYKVLGVRVYRGRNGLFGFVGEAATPPSPGAPWPTTFRDDGQGPDYTLTPPAATNPFSVTGASGVTTTDYPGVVSYFEGRRLFANTTERPTTIIGSQNANFSNFDASSPAKDSDSYEFALASVRREEIRSLVPARVLIALTSANEWSISGGASEEPITPNAIMARPHSSHGCTPLSPVVIDSTVLFVQRKGCVVRSLDFSQSAETYQGQDVSLLAKHLFAGFSIVDWDYAEEPHSIVWVVRSDGVLLSFTYVKEHEVWAWARHYTGEDEGDGFEAVCAVPEGPEDAIYLVARRTVFGVTRRYIERLQTRLIEEMDEAIFMDSSSTYSGPPATVITGLDYLEGRTVVAMADGGVVATDLSGNPLVVTGGQIDISGQVPDGARLVHVGLPYVSELETLDVVVGGAEVRARVKVVAEVGFEVEATRGLWVGEDADHLVEVRPRTVFMGFGPPQPFSGLARVAVQGRWGTESGRALLRQIDPLPCTVLAVLREVEFGGSGPT